VHPAIVLPAIAAARQELEDNQSRFAELVSQLAPPVDIPTYDPREDAPPPRPLSDVQAFKFWAMRDDEVFSTFMAGFAIQLEKLRLPDTAYAKLPVGYGIARYVLRFETQCRFDAWLALENMGEDGMKLTRHFYRHAAMPEEAAALKNAEAAWYQAGGDEGDGHDAAGEAYAATPNPNADEDERWYKLLNLLRRESMWKA
jgi:hypothetical protein